MKYFVVSDIHGHYNELLEALNKTGFDELNESHQLIVNGDMCDRGSQSKEVIDYVYRLYLKKKAIVLKGNHETFLEDVFKGDAYRISFNIKHNGLGKTLESLIPMYHTMNIFEMKDYLAVTYPFLESWLNSLPYFFETEHYVITHAGLDFRTGDYRTGNFEEAIWTRSEHFFETDLVKEFNFKKKVVVGHRMTFILREYFNSSEVNDFSIYEHTDGQKIGIDGGSYYTKHINIFQFTEN